MTRKLYYNLLSYLGCLLIAFLFCLKFSLTTSFIYNGIHGADSAIFYIIGKYWSQGYLPYVDLWDHKGPIIFFINCIGHLLTGDKIGVFILQVASLSVFEYFTLLTFRIRFNLLISGLLTIVSLFWLACSYEAGNLTEEYLLPYLAASVYFTVVWLEKRKTEPVNHHPWQAFLLGFILGFSLLTRLTNALGACGMMLAVAIILFIEKRWRNLWKNILFFILGFFTIVTPFCIYFYINGALNEMVFGSFIYNISFLHSSTQNSIHASFGIKNLLLFSIMSVNGIGLFFLSFYSYIRDKSNRTRYLIWILSTLLICSWLVFSNLNSHYRTLLLPFFPVLIIELFNSSFLNRVLRYGIIALLVFGPVYLTCRKWFSFVEYFDDRSKNQILCSYVNDNVKSIGQETDSFIGYAINQGVYIDLNIKPCYRYFSFQETQSSKSKELQMDVLSTFNSHSAKYILVNGDNGMINTILTDYYYPLQPPPELPNYHLWVRKDIVHEVY